MKKILLFTFVLTFALGLQAQYYYLPAVNTGSNPGGLNNDDEFPFGGGLDASWTLLQGPSATPVWSSTNNIPFSFDVNGNTFNSYMVSTTGVLTFTTTATTVPGTSNTTLPSPSIPDNSIMVWGLQGTGANDNIVTKTFGTAPNRQHWIFFASYSYPGLSSWTYFSIVLEETTNKVYFVDQRNNNPVSSVNLTLGIQIDGTTAVQEVNSPNVNPNSQTSAADRSDNWYWEFIPGTQPQFDFGMDAIGLTDYLDLNNAPFDVTGDLSNFGTALVTSFNLNYSVDGGPVVTDAVSGVSILNGDTYSFTHSTQWAPANAGTYTITVWASDLNGNADENSLNDSITKTVQVIDGFVERNALHEVFTSSTCPPCAPGNANTTAIFNNSFETPVIIKYQMSWPGTGDPYYTLEGLTRRNYYGVNSVPNMAVDGGWNGNTNSYTDGLLNQFSGVPSFLDIAGNYTIDTATKTVDINFGYLPLTDFPGNNTLHVAILEEETFNNVKTNGETVFDHVMKKMLPDGNGTSIGSINQGFPVTYNFNYTFNGNYRLPNNATDPIDHTIEHSVEEFDDLIVVVFIQNNSTDEVYHSSFGIEQPTTLDMQALSFTTADTGVVGSPITIEGEVRNNNVTPVTSFDIVYTINGGFPFRYNVTGVNLNQGDAYTFAHTRVWNPGTAGYYKVDVYVDNVNGAGINTPDDLEVNDGMFKYITVANSGVGLPVHEVAKSVNVYPNPTDGMVHINTATEFAKGVEVYTLMGNKVASMELGAKGIYELDMRNLRTGVYVLRFITENGTFSERIVIE